MPLKNARGHLDQLMNAVADRDQVNKLRLSLVAGINRLNNLVRVGAFRRYRGESPPEGLEGEVLSVPRPDTVEISVGADDGVRKGHKFVVTRPSSGGKYVGLIKVCNSVNSRTVRYRPDKSLLNDRIQKGDHVKAKAQKVAIRPRIRRR